MLWKRDILEAYILFMKPGSFCIYIIKIPFSQIGAVYRTLLVYIGPMPVWSLGDLEMSELLFGGLLLFI